MRPTLAFSGGPSKRMRIAYTLDCRSTWAEWWLVRCWPSRGIDYTERISLYDGPGGDERTRMLTKANINVYTFIDELNGEEIKDHKWVTHAYQIWRLNFGNATWRHNGIQGGGVGHEDDEPDEDLEQGDAYEGERLLYQEEDEGEADGNGEAYQQGEGYGGEGNEEGDLRQDQAQEAIQEDEGYGRMREAEDAEVTMKQEEFDADVLHGTPPANLFAPSPRPRQSRLVGRGSSLHGVYPARFPRRPSGPSNMGQFRPPL